MRYASRESVLYAAGWLVLLLLVVFPTFLGFNRFRVQPSFVYIWQFPFGSTIYGYTTNIRLCYNKHIATAAFRIKSHCILPIVADNRFATVSTLYVYIFRIPCFMYVTLTLGDPLSLSRLLLFYMCSSKAYKEYCSSCALFSLAAPFHAIIHLLHFDRSTEIYAVHNTTQDTHWKCALYMNRAPKTDWETFPVDWHIVRFRVRLWTPNKYKRHTSNSSLTLFIVTAPVMLILSESHFVPCISYQPKYILRAMRRMCTCSIFFPSFHLTLLMCTST